MHKLQKLILEAYAEVNEMATGSKKLGDMPDAFVKALEKKYGEVDMENDFISPDLDTYYKYAGTDPETGSINHDVHRLPSFYKLYDEFETIISDIKKLMSNEDIRKDKAARELFELIKTNFRKLQSYLRTERPDQYAVIRGRAELKELHESFVKHASLIHEMNQDEIEDGTYAGRPVKVHMHGKVTEWFVEFSNGKKVPYSDTIANIKHPSKPSYLSESLLDEVEDEPQPEEEGDTNAPKETVLEDATDKILGKFPTLRAALIKLQTEDFKEFVESIDWISPRPTSFRINLKNGQDYILKWTGKSFEAQILGKRYLISNIAEYQQALDKLAILYKEAPLKGAGEGEGFEPEDSGAGGGGGGGILGGAEGGGEGEAEGGEEGGGILGGEEGGGEDLSGEPVDFEETGEEPEA